MTNNNNRLIIIALVIVIVILAVVLLTQNHGGPATPGTPSNSGNSTGQQSPAATSSTKPTGTTTGTGTTPKPKPYVPPASGFTIHLLTPISGQTWTIAQQNLISWDRAAGVSGQIQLLDANTKAVLGVILPQTGPQQTSFNWTARFMQISRTSPSLTSPNPGTYLVRVVFDGNNLSAITSGPVTLVAGK